MAVLGARLRCFRIAWVLGWCAAATFPPSAWADSVVVFNEIMYHPKVEAGQVEVDTEWLELHNQMGVDVDMSGWSLTDGVEYLFPEGTIIPAGGYLVVAASPSAMQQATGFSGALGPYVGRLENSGERLELRNNSFRLMDSLRYRDEGRWPVAPDGAGVSLAKIRPAAGSEDASNWTSSSELGGTPGEENFTHSRNGTSAPSGLVSFWSFDETGSTARDSIGGNHGTLESGATRQAGAVGSGSVSFNNTSTALIDCGPGVDNNFATSGGMTIEALVQPQWTGSAGDYDEIIRKEDGFNRFLLGFQHDGITSTRDVPISPLEQPVLSFGINVGGEYSELDMPLDGQSGRPSLSDLQDGDWHHVAATYDRETGVKAIYVDGALAFSVNLGAGKSLQSGGSSTCYIGNMAGRGEPFNGGIDEVAFWNRALSGEEVSAHAAAAQVGLDYFAAGGGKTGEVPVAFNEISPVDAGGNFVELVNHGTTPVDLSGYVLASRGAADNQYELGSESLAAGEYLVLANAELGFDIVPGHRLFLYTPGFTAVIGAAEVRPGLRGREPEGTGRWRIPSRATPGALNLFSFNDQVVINEVMYHPRPLGAKPPVIDTTSIIAIDDPWRYEASGVDLGTSWRSPGFDDSGWRSGRALIYHEGADLPAPKNTEIELGPLTFYFRKQFEFNGEAGSSDLQLRPIVDDGAVFYLNGTEVFRLNMPSGTIDASSTALSGVSDATFSGPFTIPGDALQAGTNTLAVEVHQVSSNSSDVVFGLELFGAVTVEPGRPFSEPPEAWVELFNRSDAAVDLSGWRFDAGIGYEFAPGTVLPAGEYIVVAEDADLLRTIHPNARIVGNFTRRLSNSSDRLRLEDRAGNPVDEVEYFDGGRWPAFADGGGASIELRDPWADNSVAEAWAASEEGSKSEWKDYSYDMIATRNGGPTQWNEFVFGLLDDGEILIDDISVVEDPNGTAIQFISNTSFESGATDWRIIGNHRHSEVVTDPGDASNRVLHVVATGATEHMHNHAETTLRAGETVTDGRLYRVSFRAKWLIGSNQVHTRLYFNRVPRTTLLDVPRKGGTPGAPNSQLQENIGPTFTEFRHLPVIPASGEAIDVVVTAGDPDGVAGVRLWWSVDGGAWQMTTMSSTGGGRYSGSIPGQSSSRTIQFYAEATDGNGVTATFPAGGRDSRALIRVEDGQARLSEKHNFRIVMLPADATFLHTPVRVMSNQRMPCTVVYNEREVFYDVPGVRLKGSERGRNQPGRVGFNVRFNDDQRFRGVQKGVAIDRSGGFATGTNNAPDEIIVKHLIQRAGLPGSHNDLIRVLAPQSRHNDNALLQMARVGSSFLDAQYTNGSDGTVFEFELIYYPRTVDSSTGMKLPEPDSVIGHDLRDRGDDKEVYRWNLIPTNNRDRDDFDGLIAFCKAMSLTGSALENRIVDVMDVDQWMRTFAMQSLTGIGDSYTRGNNHNLRIYVRPQDQRALAFPWDWDFAFVQSASAGLWGNQNLQKVITRPKFLHLYYGHLYDIIRVAFNPTYMSRWITHYGQLAERDYGIYAAKIRDRRNYVLSRLPDRVDFAITTNGGKPFTVNTPEVVLEGEGWIDVRSLGLLGREDPLDLEWTAVGKWSVSAPLAFGENDLTLVAFDHNGNLLDSASIRVTSTFDPPDPVIDSVLPAEGEPDTGVVISGSGFLPGIAVRFDATPAAGVELINSHQVRVTVPDMPPGLVTVSVRNTDGGTSNPVAFTVLAVTPRFIRGDANMDGGVNVADAVRALAHMFRGVVVDCQDAVDADDNEALEVTDALYVLNYLFAGGPRPPAPFPSRGPDGVSGGGEALTCARGL